MLETTFQNSLRNVLCEIKPHTLHQVKVCGLFGQLLADESTADKDSVKIDIEGEIVGFKEKKVDAPLLLAAPAPEAALAIMNGDAAVGGDKGSEMDNEGGGGPVDAEMAALLATNLWIDCKEAREYRPNLI